MPKLLEPSPIIRSPANKLQGKKYPRRNRSAVPLSQHNFPCPRDSINNKHPDKPRGTFDANSIFDSKGVTSIRRIPVQAAPTNLIRDPIPGHSWIGLYRHKTKYYRGARRKKCVEWCCRRCKDCGNRLRVDICGSESVKQRATDAPSRSFPVDPSAILQRDGEPAARRGSPLPTESRVSYT